MLISPVTGGGVVASGAVVLENGARVGGVDPDELEDGIAEDGIGCAEEKP